jgi:type II secretory pathway pseudopilin PulG
MNELRSHSRRAFTLLEVGLVVGLLVLISAMVVPTFIEQIKGDALARSGRQLRSLIALVRANAAFDGKRYRIRFPNEDELDLFGGQRQPLIEREDDPIDDPEIFNLVTVAWTINETLLGDVWCAEVRMGRPTVEETQALRKRVAEDIEEKLEEAFGKEELDPRRPPLNIEPDGTSEWATFVLTDAPPDIEVDSLEDYAAVELIVDGPLGLAWLQRPISSIRGC